MLADETMHNGGSLAKTLNRNKDFPPGNPLIAAFSDGLLRKQVKEKTAVRELKCLGHR